MDDIPKTAPMKPMNIGRLLRGTIKVTMTVDPAVMPAVPTPAMARPIMKAVEFGAAPQMAEPTSKTTTQTR
jgi:hypothetical protein